MNLIQLINVGIGQKPKRGRPPAAKKALVRQEPPSSLRQEATKCWNSCSSSFNKFMF